MPTTPKARSAFKVSDSLNRQLNAYVQVASAAGVSVLALAAASEARVVYTETHQVTHTGFPLYVDLNHDGIVTADEARKAASIKRKIAKEQEKAAKAAR